MRLCHHISQEDSWVRICFPEDARDLGGLQLAIEWVFLLSVVGHNNVRRCTIQIDDCMNGRGELASR